MHKVFHANAERVLGLADPAQEQPRPAQEQA
jgi:hypothetical protein